MVTYLACIQTAVTSMRRTVGSIAQTGISSMEHGQQRRTKSYAFSNNRLNILQQTNFNTIPHHLNLLDPLQNLKIETSIEGRRRLSISRSIKMPVLSLLCNDLRRCTPSCHHKSAPTDTQGKRKYLSGKVSQQKESIPTRIKEIRWSIRGSNSRPWRY